MDISNLTDFIGIDNGNDTLTIAPNRPNMAIRTVAMTPELRRKLEACRLDSLQEGAVLRDAYAYDHAVDAQPTFVDLMRAQFEDQTVSVWWHVDPTNAGNLIDMHARFEDDRLILARRNPEGAAIRLQDVASFKPNAFVSLVEGSPQRSGGFAVRLEAYGPGEWPMVETTGWLEVQRFGPKTDVQAVRS